MSYFTTDEMKLIGVVPFYEMDPLPVGKIPHRGNQVITYSTIVNGGIIMHTVNAGYVLYVSMVSLSASSDVAGKAYMYARDTNDALVYYLIYTRCYANQLMPPVVLTFLPPLEIPAGYDLIIGAEGAGLEIHGVLHGYELPPL